jgi:hypothetical protein
MYLYKYMFKGPDHSQFHVHHNDQGKDAEQTEQQPRNEIDYVNGCYLGSIEAAWRMLGFHITKKTGCWCSACASPR